MKTFLKVVSAVCVLSGAPVWGADLMSTINTEANQKYNKGYRDVKDGTNAATLDCITVNASSTTLGTQNLIKGSPGFLHLINFPGACFGTFSIADSATSAINYATIISTVTTLSTAYGPASLFFDQRFLAGLAINTPASTCTVNVSYR